MKRITVKHIQQPKILQSEAQKLKEKLESLKKQIEAKKKEKETGKSVNQNSLGQSRKNNLAESQLEPSLVQVLRDLKLEAIAPKLLKKNIHSLEDLRQISQEDLDNWKDIAVGYRIKIKKYRQRLQSSNSKQKKQPLEANSPERSHKKERNIEDIIKERKEEQIYVPLNREREQDDFQEEEEIGQEEQEVMMQSLMKAFKGEAKEEPRPFQNQEQQQYSSEEEESLEQIKYEKPSQSVKVLPVPLRSAWQGQSFPEYRYCWTCLAMVKTQTVPKYNNRQFCNDVCLQKYKASCEIQELTSFYTQLQTIENQFNDHLAKIKKSQEEKPHKQKTRVWPKIRIQQEDEALGIDEGEQLDLEIV